MEGIFQGQLFKCRMGNVNFMDLFELLCMIWIIIGWNLLNPHNDFSRNPQWLIYTTNDFPMMNFVEISVFDIYPNTAS